MKNVSAAPSIGGSNIPEIVFCLYQLMFCACTVQLVIGGSFERGRIVPSLIFAFFWATVVRYALLAVFSVLGLIYPRYTVPSPAGLGIPTVGCSSFLAWISLVEDRFISPLDGQPLHMPSL